MIKPVVIDRIPFGYRNKLKTEWLNGNMPTVTKDPFGDILTKENITLDHAIPKSKGGVSCLGNYLLMTQENNIKKGNSALNKVLTKEQLLTYFEQFKGIIAGAFDGDEYIAKWSKSLKRWWK